MTTTDFLMDAFDEMMARREAQLERAEADLARRAAPMCQAAIGKEFAVRTSKTTVVKGIIVAAEYAGNRARTASTIAQFKVTMECGTSKVRREFVVEKLPR